ncbi:MAG: type II 3-dehydroquinate dehydratase [Actinomycetota bacterium]
MIAVLNGANLNMLGRRDPAQYGSLTLSELESRVYAWAGELNLTARCFQTNHEGALIDHIHEAAGWATGMIVNPGAWTHYSYAIRDALEIVAAPVVEVHLSDIATREEWRRQSVIRDVVDHAIAGEGPDGYRLALEWLRGTLAHG